MKNMKDKTIAQLRAASERLEKKMYAAMGKNHAEYERLMKKIVAIDVEIASRLYPAKTK